LSVIGGGAIAFTVSQRIAAIANGAVGSVFDLSQFLASGNDWVGAGVDQRETSQQIWGRSQKSPGTVQLLVTTAG